MKDIPKKIRAKLRRAKWTVQKLETATESELMTTLGISKSDAQLVLSLMETSRIIYRVRSLSVTKVRVLETRRVNIDGKIRTPSREYFFQPNEEQPVDSLSDYEVLLEIGNTQNACCGRQIEKKLFESA